MLAPRSGAIYVAQGVSLGKKSIKDEPRSGGISTFVGRCRTSAAHLCGAGNPNAHALGYVDCAAPRRGRRHPTRRRRSRFPAELRAHSRALLPAELRAHSRALLTAELRAHSRGLLPTELRAHSHALLRAPRSGAIYVAQGVSLGKESVKDEPRSGGISTFVGRCRRSAAHLCGVGNPNADALGYVDGAAPRRCGAQQRALARWEARPTNSTMSRSARPQNGSAPEFQSAHCSTELRAHSCAPLWVPGDFR